MQIEITGEAEQLIRAALASGKYASAAEYIAALAKGSQPKGVIENMPELPKHLDIDVLAVKQSVGLIRNSHDLEADFLPTGWSSDEFVGEIHSLREQSLPRTR